MPIGTLHEGITVDFADVLLIINVFAIAMLLTLELLRRRSVALRGVVE